MSVSLVLSRSAVKASLFPFGKEYDPAMIKAFPPLSRLCIVLFINSNYPKLEYLRELYSSGFFAIVGKRFPAKPILL
jgi:hypothetical protein